MLETPKTMSAHQGGMSLEATISLDTMGNQQERSLEVDLSWLAGVWEGEGCIGVSKLQHSKNRPGCISFNIYCSLVNTEKPLIDSAVAVLKRAGLAYRIYFVSSAQRKSFGWKSIWNVRICGLKNCYRFLETLSPYFRGVRKQRAMLLQQFIAHRLAQPYGEKQGAFEVRIYEQLKHTYTRRAKSSTTNTPSSHVNGMKIESELLPKGAETPRNAVSAATVALSHNHR